MSQLKTFGRRDTGFLATTPSGVRIFFLKRRNNQIWRGKGLTQSEALTQDKATWSACPNLLGHLRKIGVKQVVVFVQDTGDLYASRIEDWYDRSKANDKDAGPRQLRHLGIAFMSRRTVYSRLTLQKI